MTDERRKWAHRRGDRYYLLLGEAVGNERDGFRIEHALCAQVDYSSVGEAKSAGLRTLGRSDDFNIAAVRDGHLVAVLWMDEIVDDGFDVLTEIATEVGLGLPVEASAWSAPRRRPKMTEPTTAEKRRIAAIGRVRKLIDQKVREGYAYQWWIDLDGPRLLAIVETVLDAKPDGGQRD